MLSGHRFGIAGFPHFFRPVSTTGQTVILSILIIVLGFNRTQAAMSLVGVTAHGSPGGPLQFDRLEAALAAKFH